MNFRRHSNLEGKHSFLSASSYHWINYDIEKLEQRYRTAMAAEQGTKLHEFAAHAIRMKRKLADTQTTVEMYVNDAIDFNMSPEVVLYYSDNAFGTADAISFKDNILRIHDLKTGTNPVNITQLLVYAAYFCLEYDYLPSELDEIELRIYQNDKIIRCNSKEDSDVVPVITSIMDVIITFDKHITKINREDTDLK